MGGTKLCLLLLLGTYTLAQQDVGSPEESPTCFLAKRFKNFRRFVYDYEAESLNGVNGAIDNKSGPKVTCRVEVDVPQTCSFIMRTTECSLTEVSGVDSSGNPVHVPAAGSENFRDAMAMNPLKFTVQEMTNVNIFPENDEPKNILNIKRGIISSLMVPVMEEEKNNEMPTVHGVCATDFTVNSREDIATEVTLRRDLSKCDSFDAVRQHTSPLAIISGMHYPLSKLISSEQTCNYRFDNQKKHMTSGVCTEKHLFLPFSHKNEYGISTLVKQTVTLREVAKINDRVFDNIVANGCFLPMEAVDDKSPVQTKDAAIALFKDLMALKDTTEGEKRANLFRKLVSELRSLKSDAVEAAALEMFDLSQRLMWQSVVQCGTPECLSAMLKVLRTFPHEAYEVDAVVFALGLLPNPSRLLVKDLLAMAQYKQSKAIMYTLGNVARKLYDTEGATPEVMAVYDFINSILGADCSGEKELTFLTLRIVGNMGDMLEAIDPSIKGTLLKCMRQPATTLSVQLAAIQAFRRMEVTDEVRANLQRVSQYPKGAVQKRLAAYLMLMRSYQDSDIEMVKKLINQEQNAQVKAFVTSHIYNIMTSSDAAVQELRSKLTEALQDTDVDAHSDYASTSRNYKLPSVQGNVIFDPNSQLPREVLLETTLEAFGYKKEIFEFGMEGKGLEPAVEILFGKNGFFPDAVSKALYWAEDKMSPKIMEVLDKWTAPLKLEGQKVPDNLFREIDRNFNKVLRELQNMDLPDATAYLRILGNELGYIKTSELQSIAQNAIMYTDIFMLIIPRTVVQSIVSGTDNDLFVHYLFMDNKFTLPTASGLPLRFELSGTFTPGAMGGLSMSRKMTELVFRPSAGVEFMTKMGVHVPEFVDSAIEMTTNMYHESSMNAKISLEQNQIKLSIPTPQGTNKLLHIRNKVMVVGPVEAAVIPATDSETDCRPAFPGIKYCTTMMRGNTDDNNSPYFPLNGEALFALDVKPLDEVSEYTATIGYDLLSEGKEGRHKVDTVKVALRAEGVEPIEATMTMKYNRNKNVFTTQIQIPDIDVEAGVKIGMTDSSSRGKSLTLEISNKNVPQLSLIGRAKLQSMTDGMLQVQLLVPSLRTDAAITATMNRAEGLMMELKSDVKLPETTSIQAITFKYGEEKAEVKLMSSVNAQTKVFMDYNDALQAWLREFVEDVMDQKVVKTDMKLRHIINKGLEASTIWVDKVKGEFPYVETLRDNIANMDMPSMPENLFMNFESGFTYEFNKDTMTIFIPVPYGGKSSQELRIPEMLTTPRINVRQLGLDLSPQEIQIPTFTVPYEYELAVPLMGKMEMTTKVESTFYNWEAMVTVGNNTVESPNYKAEYVVKGESPISLLSFTNTGNVELFEEFNGVTTALFFGLRHELLRSEIKVRNNFGFVENIWSGGRIVMTAKCPGVETSMSTSAQFTFAPNMLSGDMNSDASMSIGSMDATCTSQNTFSFEPAKREAKAESTVRFNSEIVKLANKVKMSYANGELLLDSNMNMNSEPIKHTTKVNVVYKDVKLSIQTDSVTKAEEKMVRSQMELLASGEQVTLRIENQADDSSNRAYSLLTGSLTPSGLEINSDASVNIFSSLASHKATLTLDGNGLTTSCTTTAQFTPLTFENVFHGGVDASGATVSLTTKGGIRENKAELSVEGKIANTEVYLNSIMKGNLFDLNARNRVNLRLNNDGLIASNNMVASYNDISTKNSHTLSLTMRSLSLQSKTDNFLNDKNTYIHDINMNIERFTANIVMKNDLKVMDINFNNDAQFKAEPYTVEFVGTMMSSFSEEEMRHTYEFKFVDMVLSAKCNTNGKLLGSRMTHTTDMELSGLTLKFNDVANFNSPYLRLDSTVKTVAAPFTLNIDAISNSNGDISFYGQQSGEMYSKFLMKAEPLMFTHSFEYRASTSHELTEGPIIKTNMDNKFNSLLNLKEQSVTLKMTSNVNEHAFDHEINAFNNAEKVGIEMKVAASTPLFADNSRTDDYSVSGFVIYEKNGDSYIMIPFVEDLPALIENIKMTMMKLMDQGIDTIKDFDTNYKISTRLQNKVTELKEVIDNFDVNLFVQDLKKFLSSIENTITNLTAKFPTDKVVAMLKSMKEAIIDWINKYSIVERFNVFYAKIEEILSNYEVEKMIGALMDEIVKIMKQYQVREKIQAAFAALKSIDIKPVIKRVMLPIQGLVEELYAVDFKQLIDDMNDFVLRMVQKIRSFDYETFTMELTEKVKEMSSIPCFGKLSGEFKVASPHYNMKTNADFENNTATSDTPDFLLKLKSNAMSKLSVLDYTLDASANVVVPKMSHLTFTENIKFDQSMFKLDHQGTMSIYRHSALASSETNAKADTELYMAELINKASLTMESGLSGKVETNYKQELKFPPFNIFTDAVVNQITMLELQDGSATLKMENLADGKVNNRDVIHKSDMEIVMDLHTAKVTFNGATGITDIKVSQKLDADICLFRHVIVDAKIETEAPFLKNSVAEAKFQAKVEDLKIDFTASHNAELVGKVEGTLANSVVASVTPDDVMFEAKNKGNGKVALPFKLSGKTDLQNDISFALNPREQSASWTGLARFNQYKYSHFISMDNGEREMNLVYQINGEANLEVLKETVTIPEIYLPLVDITLPGKTDFSLWEDGGLSYFFITPQQTLDINSNLKYTKTPDMIVIPINMDPVINAINTNAKTLHKKMLIGKDKAADVIAQAYSKVKEEYEKYDIPLLPKTIDIKMPSALSKLTLPKVALPKISSIRIPRLGDLNYEFSMKTAMITLKTDASLLNQDDIVMKLDASSTSEFDFLNGKIEGNAAVKTNDGLKLESALAVKHPMVELNHDNAVLLGSTIVDASVTNSAKLNLPYVTYEIYQTMNVNPDEGLVVSMSTPSAGLIGAQIQPKSLMIIKARLYGRYPSIPTDDVDIIDLRLSAMNSINLQTNWNMEMPYQMMLAVKEEVDVTMISGPVIRVYNDIYSEGARYGRVLKRSFERVKRDGRSMLRRAVDTIGSVQPNEFINTVADKGMMILRKYRSRVELVFDAIINFLRETQFQIPGYEERLSGLEIYEKCITFVADVSEEAIQKIPEYFSSMFAPVIEYFKSLEFVFSNQVVRGSEILEDFTEAFNKLQQQVIVIVREIGNIQLEDIINKMNVIVQFATAQGEKFLQMVQSLNFEKLTDFMTNVYNDAVNSQIFAEVAKQCQKICDIVLVYFNTVRARVLTMVDDMSLEQLQADIQAWMDRMIKSVNAFQNNAIETLKEKSKSVETFVKVGDRNIEIDIPFPFGKSN